MRAKLCVHVALFAAAALALAACKVRRAPGSALRGEETETAPVVSEVTFDMVRKLIEDNRIKSVDTLLPLLPDELRGRYVLLRESRSTQDGAPTAPRVLLYASDASFVMAFNGEASQAGYEKIETYQFDAATSRFLFREIEFPAAGQSGDAHFTEVNPRTCTGCHKVPPRPIFDQWPRWPDAYFGADTTAPGVTTSADDTRDFKTFREQHAGTGRYQYLRRMDEYATEARVKRGEPANSFNQLVLALVEKQIEADLRAHPRYEAYKYAFDAAIAGCADIPTFLSPAATTAFARTFAAIRQDSVVKNATVSPTLVALRWLFENHDLKTQHWAPGFKPNYKLVRGADSGDGPRLTRIFPSLSCVQLKERSLAATADL